MGVSLYFETLRTLGWAMAGLFALALPAVVIPFVANPDAAADARRAGGPLGALRCAKGARELVQGDDDRLTRMRR